MMINQLDQDFFTLQNIISLNDRLYINKQAQLVKSISAHGSIGLRKLLDLLVNRRLDTDRVTYIDGMLLQELYFSQSSNIRNDITKYFYMSIVKSNSIIDYIPLEKALIVRDFKSADQLTQMYLCSLAGLNFSESKKRNWLYFTDILSLPSEDLKIIDGLWKMYSQERFGFSIQRNVWLENNCDWDQLWINIGWKKHNIPLRYPNEFTWDVSAPFGHLPLCNQLRGVQVLSSLFNHSVWDVSNSN